MSGLGILSWALVMEQVMRLLVHSSISQGTLVVSTE